MKIWKPPLGEFIRSIAYIDSCRALLVATGDGVYLLDENDLRGPEVQPSGNPAPDCAVAQAVERETHNPEVPGASPGGATDPVQG